MPTYMHKYFWKSSSGKCTEKRKKTGKCNCKITTNLNILHRCTRAMYCSNFEGEPWIIIYLVKSSRKLLWCYLSFQQMFWNVLIKLHISNTSLTECAKLWIKLGKSNKLPTIVAHVIVYNLWYAATSKNEF